MTESALRTSHKLKKPHIYFSSLGLLNKGCWAYNPATIVGVSSLRAKHRISDWNIKAYAYVQGMYKKRKYSNTLF